MSKQKEQPLDITQPVEVEVQLPFQDSLFVITGELESLQGIIAITEAQDADLLAHRQKVAAPVVKPAVERAPQATNGYINLAELNDRDIARMSLKAVLCDARTLGRNNEYRRFKERVSEEKDLAMDMKLGIVQSVHCRLHERMLQKIV